VEEAFYTTDRVLTCSFHKFGEYFPGTGHVDDHGWGKGLGYAVNVPLRDGLTDETFKGVFEPVIQHILDWYRPSAVVLQCGADSLSGDKLGCFNLTMEGHANSVQYLRQSGLPLILLGGGGYTIKNVARAWAYETACALGIENSIDRNLPWNSYFEWFGPRYRLEVAGNNMEDLNPKDGYLDSIQEQVLKQLKLLPFAPSVGMHEVPRQSLGEHLGMPTYREDGKEDSDNLDERLAQKFRLAYDFQRNESSSSDTDEPESLDSDDAGSNSSRRRRRPHRYVKRMSLLGSAKPNGHDGLFDDESPGAAAGSARGRRRFFQSSAVWDPMQRMVITREIMGPGALPLDALDDEGRLRGMDIDVENDNGQNEDWKEGDKSVAVAS